MKYIVCIGGSGQIVLHYYLQLYLLGLVEEPFHAIVIDTDEIIPSIQVVQNFFKELQYGQQKEEMLGATIPVIEAIRIKLPQGETALEILGGIKDLPKTDPHVTQAFFSSETLRQNVMQGLFARPALSTVISEQILEHEVLALKNNSVAVVVGSVIGGTGGGLIAPVIDTLKKRAQKSNYTSTLKAVFLGEYFSPDPKIIEGGRFRFQSNQLLVLLAIKEALKELDRFYFIGGPGAKLIERDPNREKEAKNLAWPMEEDHPLWEGVRALQYLLTETTMDRPMDFPDRETERLKPQKPFKFEEAKHRLTQALDIINQINTKKVIIRLRGEPWVREIWGGPLTDLIIHFWGIAAQKKIEGGKNRVKAFPNQVQDALKGLWSGQGDKRGLESIFSPVEKAEKGIVTPRDIRRIAWPKPEGTPETELFKGSGTTAWKAAATLLFWALRKGV